jgi:hypothetical protein
MLLGAGAGAAFYGVLISGLLNMQGSGEARWLAPPLMLRNLGLLWTQYLGIFGAAAPSGELVMSRQGIYWVAKLCIAMFLLWLVPAACRRRMVQPLSGGAFLVVFAMALGIVTLFFQLTTSIADPSDPVASGRYLLPPAILLLFVALAHRLDFKSSPIQSAAVILIASSFVATAWAPIYANVVSMQNVKRRHDLIALQNYLLQNDLRYGYATYWNSAPLTVISAEKVRVRPIISVDRLPLPAPWISSMRWYRPQEWTGPTFLLLTPEETKLFDWNSMATHGVVPARRTHLGGFEIVVFDRNLLAEFLPGWSAPLHYVRSRP